MHLLPGRICDDLNYLTINKGESFNLSKWGGGQECYFYSSLAEERTRKKQVVGMKPTPDFFPLQCVSGLEGSWLALNQG